MDDKIVSLAVTVPDVATNPVNVVAKTLAVVKYNRVPSAIAVVVDPIGKYKALATAAVK